ncbi:MAG: hypothetical protein AAFY31_06455, partial [Pseudomonadota bacterium]
MIQIVFECDGEVPIAFHHDAVTGVRVEDGGRFFQAVEGPESAVMLTCVAMAKSRNRAAAVSGKSSKGKNS